MLASLYDDIMQFDDIQPAVYHIFFNNFEIGL